MPRPKRTRRAVAGGSETPVPASLNDIHPPNDDASRPRGRPKTRSWRLNLGEQDAISSANRTRDAALDRLAAEDATTASGLITGDDTMSPIELGLPDTATPVMQRDTTGLDLADDDVFGDLDDSFADSNIPREGLSIDDLSLMSSHVKPRSRQSSFIGRNEHAIRPSSRGPNPPDISSSFNIGRFRRRTREPSILGTSRKPLPGTAGIDQNSEQECEPQPEPEAQHMPLSRRRETRRSVQSNDMSPARPSSRKRKSDEACDGDQPGKSPRVESAAAPSEVNSDSELSALASPSSLLIGALVRPVTPVNQAEITAPPASSGSEGGVDIWPDIHILAKRRRRQSLTTPHQFDNLSDISSPPSLTHSPNYKQRLTRQRGRATMQRPESPKITTAVLTNLLPKRRHKRTRDSFGLESDELDGTDLAQDDDELSYLDARAARKRKGNRKDSRTASARSGSRAASRSASEGSILKPKHMPAPSRRSAQSANTYRPRSSDKENESDGDEEGQSGFVPLPDNSFNGGTEGRDSESRSSASADELKQAANKFKEVDKWELEFEGVTELASPQNAR